MKKQKRVVITGASGFVGRYVVQRLLQEDYEIFCMVRNAAYAEAELANENIHYIQGDITSPASLEKAFQGAYAVINLAGMREFWCRNRKDFYNINHKGALNVFNACLKNNVKRVIQVSTPLSFGVPESIPFNETSAPGKHPSDYAKSKYLGDREGMKLMKEKGLPLTIVYLAAVIGSGDDKETMEVKRAVTGNMPALVGADTTYTYVYVKDAAEAIVRALLNQNAVGESYLVGKERATTREYFEIIGDIADVKIPSINIPTKLLIPVAKVMEKASLFTGKRPELPLDVLKTTEAGSLLFDCSKSERELDMHYTPLKHALSDAVSDFA